METCDSTLSECKQNSEYFAIEKEVAGDNSEEPDVMIVSNEKADSMKKAPVKNVYAQLFSTKYQLSLRSHTRSTALKKQK